MSEASDNTGESHGLDFIDPDDEEFKKNFKKCAEKVWSSDARNRREECRKACSAPGICKVKYACIVEAGEATRMRVEGTKILHIGHEDNIAGKGINRLNHCNMVHKFIPLPQKQWQYQMQKQQCIKSGKNLKRYRHGSWRMSETKKRWSVKQGEKEKQYTLRRFMDISRIRSQSPNRVVLRGDIVKYDSGSYAVFTEQGSSASQMMAAQEMMSLQDYQGAEDKKRTQYQLTPRLKWRMHHHVSKFRADTNGLNHGPAWMTQSLFLSGESVWSYFGRTFTGKTIRESSKNGWDNVPN